MAFLFKCQVCLSIKSSLSQYMSSLSQYKVKFVSLVITYVCSVFNRILYEASNPNPIIKHQKGDYRKS